MRRDWRRFLTTAAILGLAVLGTGGCKKANTQDSNRTEAAAESTEPGTAQSGPEKEGVVYQDGLWIVTTRVQDFSAGIIPKGESAQTAGAFCIDDTTQQYARSLYNDEYGQNISGSMLLKGTGLPESGVRFPSYGASYDYGQLKPLSA